jgi:hypothetical protein
MVSGLLQVPIDVDFSLAVHIKRLFYGFAYWALLEMLSKEGRLAGCSAVRRFRLTPALSAMARACKQKRRRVRRREQDASTQLPASSFQPVICEAMEIWN